MRNQNIFYRKRLSISLLSISLMMVLLLSVITGCKKEPAYKDVVLITGADVSNVINFTVDGAGSSTAITATATGMVNQDITVAFKTDSILLKAYNTTNGTNFYALPAGTYTLSANSGIIKSGSNVSNAVSLTINSTNKLVDGRNYMVPVTIDVTKGNLGVLKSSGTAFYKINRVVTTNVADVTNGPLSDRTFPKIVTLNKFTFEFRVKVSQFASSGHISRLGYFQDTLNTSAHTFNFFRFGELSDAINQFQWINNVGKVSSKTLFATNTWYTISCVFDGSTCTMYINGVADGSFAASGQSFMFNELSLFYYGQNLAGQISELRLWSRALAPGEIQNGFCGVDPASAGLLAYWKFNEGTGNAITDYSGHGYSFSAGSNYNWVVGIKCPN
ncbi:DUF1735 and LamG domain-containing protein [Mucilaginibacter flavus]|uniref:DUF1735 and LamG domain-containing protein n=1 Tax=Mucilaginibacter flavus TaxID=931504 RepID=UPI0025B3E62C|nr:DUF1735 and LamG domain-containing protein [Mucilaginibacter flavus]MDN3584278.1 DUF1735 and LamG domain-containing protein [Mucilaginibacter flavus]